jgi:hypothetical protein
MLVCFKDLSIRTDSAKRLLFILCYVVINFKNWIFDKDGWKIYEADLDVNANIDRPRRRYLD